MTAAASLAVLVVIAAAIGIVVVARILGLSPARHAGAIAALVVVGLVAGLGLPALLNESTNGRISPGESWPWIVLGWLAYSLVLVCVGFEQSKLTFSITKNPRLLKRV